MGTEMGFLPPLCTVTTLGAQPPARAPPTSLLPEKPAYITRECPGPCSQRLQHKDCSLSATKTGCSPAPGFPVAGPASPGCGVCSASVSPKSVRRQDGGGVPIGIPGAQSSLVAASAPPLSPLLGPQPRPPGPLRMRKPGVPHGRGPHFCRSSPRAAPGPQISNIGPFNLPQTLGSVVYFC